MLLRLRYGYHCEIHPAGERTFAHRLGLKSAEKSLGRESIVGQSNGDRCVLAFGGHSGLSRVVDILEPIVFRDVGGDSMSLFISAKKQAGYRGKIWADDMNSSSVLQAGCKR